MAADYSTLDIKQLQAEIYRRSRLPHSKDECIKRLEELDRKSVFRFLDLPAEMRNRVYEELLTHDRGRRRATPQLLRTCRQINNEAKGMLYMSSSLTLSATFWVSDNVWAKNGERTLQELTEEDDEWINWHSKSDVAKESLAAEGYSPPPSPRMNTPDLEETAMQPRCYRPCLIRGDCTRGQIATEMSLREASKFWPRKLHDIPVINLTVSLELDPVFSTRETVPDFITFNHFLYSMTSCLSASVKPQKLILSITDGGLCSDQDLQDYLLPLAKLPQNIELQITGIVPEILSWIEDLRDEAVPSYRYDLLTDCLQLKDRMKATPIWRCADDFPHLAHSAVCSVYRYVSRLLDGSDWGCIEGEDELNCYKAVALAEEAMRPEPSGPAQKAAWLAKLRMKVVELKQVSKDYWWSWDSIREEPENGRE